MTETSGAAGQWSIGELAKACGVTVRALHHYDEIGLLSAGRRTASGHRRYTEEDVRRLYRILERQFLHLRQHAEQVQAVQDRIRDLLSRIDGAAMPAPEQFMATLEMITMLENYFTPEQRQELAGRRAELGSDSIDAAKVRWAALVEEGLRHVENGTPATDPSIREWARAWDEIGSMFHRGEETKAAARSMWQDNKAALSADLPWTPEQLAGLVAYLQKARTQP
jgi:DNA-binding transcriptional MerR regulator